VYWCSVVEFPAAHCTTDTRLPMTDHDDRWSLSTTAPLRTRSFDEPSRNRPWFRTVSPWCVHVRPRHCGHPVAVHPHHGPFHRDFVGVLAQGERARRGDAVHAHSFGAAAV
jgi:hypothetical protein